MSDNNELKIEKVIRPWGWYMTTFIGEGYKTKLFGVAPKHRLSLQSHNHRSEHWTIIKGTGVCTVGDQLIDVTKDSFVRIPLQAKHRIENLSATDELLVAEVQMGDICEEDDIIRYADDYNRAN